ncbi:MAG: type IV toxin-antitoxin system AbiEi family antitoxin domain-containing protein [Lachnospiraceae bacterium]|nr:type IV toxin-antitoxin system AbiEi family antitoxin domain-containing protein [Lachnospiraceae bacterium]
MNDHESIIKMLEQNKGIITSAQVTNAGFQRRALSELVAANRINRVERGVYALPETWDDDMYFFQIRYAKGIFSHGTSLFLHGMSDRTPQVYTLTFPHGYNAKGLKKHNIKAKYVTSDIYNLGTTEKPSLSGNMLRVYDIERTLCDIVRGNNALDVQLVNQAMKIYVESKDKDMSKLIEYAERLHVMAKILRYMEVLL